MRELWNAIDEFTKAVVWAENNQTVHEKIADLVVTVGKKLDDYEQQHRRFVDDRDQDLAWEGNSFRIR